MTSPHDNPRYVNSETEAENVYLLHFDVDGSTAAFRTEAGALAYLDQWGYEKDDYTFNAWSRSPDVRGLARESVVLQILEMGS